MKKNITIVFLVIALIVTGAGLSTSRKQLQSVTQERDFLKFQADSEQLITQADVMTKSLEKVTATVSQISATAQKAIQ